MRRVLVSGELAWSDTDAIWLTLAPYSAPDHVLVVGDGEQGAEARGRPVARRLLATIRLGANTLREVQMTSNDDPDDQPQPIDPILLPDTVNQAIGMVSEQLQVDTTKAFDHIRAYAAAHQEDLEDIADDIIHRLLNFAAK